MAFWLQKHPLSFLILVATSSLLINLSLSFNPKLRNDSLADAGFSVGFATWYGPPTGAGSDGGACGFEGAVSKPPYSSFIAAGNPNIFQGGKGCGACYQVKCTSNPLCSGSPVTVTITDSCPGCTQHQFHFDLSGTAFGALAKPGQAQNLQNAGTLDISWTRVPCFYRGANIAFKVDAGVNPYYFAAVIENTNGDGGVKYVAIASAGSSNYKPMQNTYGANWRVDIDPSFKPPFSIKLTSPNGKTVWAMNAIPANFVAGALYISNVNF